MKNIQKLIINIDGGSRGNPGSGAIGVVMSDENGNILKEYSESIGKVTNNQAEYKALIFALKKAKSLLGKNKIKTLPVEILSDSELLVNQVNGRYKIKEKEIQNLFLDFWNEKVDFGSLRIIHIEREKNKLADKLVNQALDSLF